VCRATLRVLLRSQDMVLTRRRYEGSADAKRLVDVANLPSDAEIRPEWDAFIAALNRPASQKRIKALMERGLHRHGDVENRLGFYVGQIGGCTASAKPRWALPGTTLKRDCG